MIFTTLTVVSAVLLQCAAPVVAAATPHPEIVARETTSLSPCKNGWQMYNTSWEPFYSGHNGIPWSMWRSGCRYFSWAGGIGGGTFEGAQQLCQAVALQSGDTTAIIDEILFTSPSEGGMISRHCYVWSDRTCITTPDNFTQILEDQFTTANTVGFKRKWGYQQCDAAPSCPLGKRATKECPGTDPPCTALVNVRDARLKGYQTVVSARFVKDIQHLISCVSVKSSLGNKAALDIVSASRCSSSKGLTPAGLSDHQIGRAIATSAWLTATVHITPPSRRARNCRGHPKSAQNAWVNDFLTCAGKTGLQVGATFSVGDWNHFERDVPDLLAEYKKCQPVLKTFCNKKCPQVARTNPSLQMCNCPGY